MCKHHFHQSFRDFQPEWFRLEMLGIPLEPPEYRVACGEGKGLLIRQDGDLSTNVILEACNGAISCIVHLVIVNDVPGKLFITNVILELPWTLTPVTWLPSVDPKGDKIKLYELPFEQLAYPRDLVLNPRIDAHRALRRGDMIYGLLLGVSYEPLPARYRHGCEIMAPLTVYDQLDRPTLAQMRLHVEPAQHLPNKQTPGPRLNPFGDLISKLTRLDQEQKEVDSAKTEVTIELEEEPNTSPKLAQIGIAK
jgi:hypothetical protein